MVFVDYDLPPHLIAQEPTARRDDSRLLHMDRATSALVHRRFRELPDLLKRGDLLVLNDTRVLPARLLGKRERTGGKWEGLFVAEPAAGVWELMCQTRYRPAPGEVIVIADGPLRLELLAKTSAGHWLVKPDRPGSVVELLTQFGQMPLPRYIRKGIAQVEDTERYQTVFADKAGAVAAPTAGLHFTPELLANLTERGIDQTFITLHVGAGTFQPIRVADYHQHQMHSEWGTLPTATVAAIRRCRSGGGRVVAVGTTSVRVLETVAAAGELRPWSGTTNLFIHPPYPFRCVDALITNFHLPRSTLLLLVSAFAGSDLLRRGYAAAIAQQYRFFSYGDAMFIE